MKRILAAMLVGGAGFGLFVACGTTSGSSCTLDSDCSGGQVCEGMVCVDTCTADADCGAGEVCQVGDNTEKKVCKAGSTTNNGTTNNGTTNNGTTNNTSGTNNMPTVYYEVEVLDTTSGDMQCANASNNDPGSDIMGVGLEDQQGNILGWGAIDADNLPMTDPNDNTDTTLINGSAPGLDGMNCVDFSSNTVLSLGCGGWIAVSFLDADGNPIPLDATAGQVVRVYEYGGQCGGSNADMYSVNVCTDKMGVAGGSDSSCTINLGQGASAEQSFDVTGF